MRRSVLLVALLLLPPLTLAAPAPSEGRMAPPEGRTAPPGGLAREKDAETPMLPFLAAPPEGGGSEDCGAGRDAGGHDRAVNLSLPVTCTGRLDGSDGADWYRVEVPAETSLRVTLEPTPGATRYVCITHDAYPLRDCRVGRETEAVTLSVAVESAGVRHVVLLAPYHEAGDYTFHALASPWSLPADCGRGDAGEPPMPLAPGQACVGSLDPRNDTEDRYALRLPAGEAVSVRLLPNADADYDLCVEDAASGRTLDCSIRSQGLPDATYHAHGASLDLLVRVYIWSGAGAYDLRIDPAPAQRDCGAPGDGGSWYDASPRGVPLACAGALAPADGDAADLYALTLSEPGVHVEVAGAGGTVMACLWDAEGVALACALSTDGALEGRDFLGAPQGLAYVSVETWGDENATYALGVSGYTPEPHSDCGSGGDARHDTPATIPAPVDCVGALVRGDHVDRYVFSAPEAMLRVRLETEVPATVCLAWWLCASTVNGSAEVTHHATDATTWRLHVAPAEDGATGPYRLVIQATPPFDDCGTGGDAGDRAQDADVLTTPVLSCEGRFRRPGDTYDHYAVHVEAGHAWSLTLDAPPGTEICFLYTGGGMGCARSDGTPLWLLPFVRFPQLTSGLQRFFVVAPAHDEQSYHLGVLTTADAPRALHGAVA